MISIAFITSLACAAGGPSPSTAGLPEVAVLPLRAPSAVADERTARALDVLLLAELQRNGRFSVLDTSSFEPRIGVTGIRRALRCTDASCALRVGDALGVRYVVAGSLNSAGERILLTLDLLDVRKSAPTGRATADGRSYPPSYPELVARAVAQLEPLVASPSASVLIESDPAGATLAVDGRDAGAAPQTVMLVPGEHEVRATLDGYPESTRWLSVTKDENARLVVKLSKDATGTLRVTTSPAGASVTVGGTARGSTPADGKPFELARPGR